MQRNLALGISIIVLLSLSMAPEAFPPAHSSSPIVGSGVNPGSSSITLPSGGSTYIYSATEGGAFNIGTSGFTIDLAVINGQNLTSVLIGHSTSNVGSYNPNGALFPIIGGTGVSSSLYSTQTFHNSRAPSLSGSFTLSASSLVVLASASSNNAPLNSVSSQFTIDASGSTSCCSTVVLAHASLSAGSYPFSLNYAACSPPCTSDVSSMAIGVVLYVFPAATNTSTSVGCSPSVGLIQTPIKCTATVTGSSPTGVVTFTTSSTAGSFLPPPNGDHCTLSLRSCSVTYSDNIAGVPMTITASYSGDSSNYPSTGSAVITLQLFGFQVSPESQTVAYNQSFSFQVLITPSPALGGPLTISISGLPAQGFSGDESITTTVVTRAPLTQIFTFTTNDQEPTGTLQLTFTARAGLTSPEIATARLIVSKLVGIRNAVTFSDLTVKSGDSCLAFVQSRSCLSIQQNFVIVVPKATGAPSAYWAQNVVVVGKNPSTQGPGAIAAFNIWDFSLSTMKIQGAVPIAVGPPGAVAGVSFPSSAFTLTSTISDGLLSMGSTYGSSYIGSMACPLPVPVGCLGLPQSSASGSYIIANHLTSYSAPEVELVGPVGTALIATFSSPSSGSVESSVKLADHQWSNAVDEKVDGFPHQTTGEWSMGLLWTIGGPGSSTFGWNIRGLDQGVLYVPVNPAPLISGTTFFDQMALTGVSVAVSGSSLPDETTLTMISTSFSTAPPGAGTLKISSLGLYDVRVIGLSGTFDGNARVCITSSGVSTQTVIQYLVPGIGWTNADNLNVSGSVVCGTIPLAFLSGTLIAIGNPPLISVSEFFTDLSNRFLSVDSTGNPRVNILFYKGRVISTMPSLVVAWSNMTNSGIGPLQSVKLNGTMPADWAVLPPGAPPTTLHLLCDYLLALCPVHVFFVYRNGTRQEITDSSGVTIMLGNPQSVTLSIANMTATRVGRTLGPGESILFSVRIWYNLVGTSQSMTTYPRNYNDTTTVSAWTQASFAGGEADAKCSAPFNAYARLIGYVHGDGNVNTQDLSLVAYSFGTRPGDARWNPAADLNDDGIVDIGDLSLVANYFGNHL